MATEIGVFHIYFKNYTFGVCYKHAQNNMHCSIKSLEMNKHATEFSAGS